MRLLVISVFALVFAELAVAHSGGTDRYGCHAGSRPYHCHGDGSPSRGGDEPSSLKEKEAGCDIKGNIGRGGERIYHVPGGQYYSRTIINTSRGERWFCSETEARAAGWRRALR